VICERGFARLCVVLFWTVLVLVGRDCPMCNFFILTPLKTFFTEILEKFTLFFDPIKCDRFGGAVLELQRVRSLCALSVHVD
jgi:hypothetical protein